MINSLQKKRKKEVSEEMILIFHSYRKNIMAQDTYKLVLQIYFICSTFATNKKIFQ